MPDLVVNVVHVANHANYSKTIPGALQAVPTSTNWIACGSGHATCTHSSMLSDTAQLYASASTAFGTKAIQTGDIRINLSHLHTYARYIEDSHIHGIMLTWQNCPAAHTKCQNNLQSTWELLKTSHNIAENTTGAQQSAADIVVNWSHTHNYYVGSHYSFEQVPGTCPAMHPLCQAKSPMVQLCSTAVNNPATGTALEA